MPSFIFTSNSPGTGKTTTARIIAKYLECDSIFQNAGDERSIDSLRDIIKGFAQCMSSKEGVKKMVFLDEADSILSSGQDCLKAPLELYSNNVFFIFSCNNIARIIPAIRSRCVVIDFSQPPKQEILQRLEYICQKEGIRYDIEELRKLCDQNYPDIRSMIVALQTGISVDDIEYHNFYKAMKAKDIEYLFNKTYSGSFNIMGANDFLFSYIFKNYKEFTYKSLVQISQLLADTERAWNVSTKLPIIFLANIVKISELI
jgi:DNA polymerase III delta prime subunit